MDRRAFLAGLAILAAPRAACAQPTGKAYRIGFLGIAKPSSWASYIAALRQGLRELGYEEGRNLVIEYRWAEDDFDRLPKLAAELVSMKVDAIVTHGYPGCRAAEQARPRFRSSWQRSGTRYEAGSWRVSPARVGI
jgi:putative ABC transport system substrate-binding protein